MNSQIGGDCTLCGAKKTNKRTCPFNPSSKNPNTDKHNPNKIQPKPKRKYTRKTLNTKKHKPLKKTIKILKPNVQLKLIVKTKYGATLPIQEQHKILKHHSTQTLTNFIKKLFYGFTLYSLQINTKHNIVKFHVKLDNLKEVSRQFGYLDNPNQFTNVKDAIEEIYMGIMEVGKDTDIITTYGPNGELNSQYKIETLLE